MSSPVISGHLSWLLTCGLWWCRRLIAASCSGGYGPRALAREVERARSVLLAADGVAGKRIAAIVGCAEPTVVT